MADAAKNPEEALSAKDLHKVLAKLPEKQRRVLMLTKAEGFSMAEAAAKMGMSETATKVTAHRAYKKLQELLLDETE
jgi:RNA polymerase sigma-70 factor (ECF subfamily)